MKTILLFAIAAAVTVGPLSNASFAAEESVEKVTIEELMKAHIKALGGEKMLSEVKNIVRSGDAFLDGDFGEFQGTVKESKIIGKKIYRAWDLAAIAETLVWDGEKGWQDSSSKGKSELEGDKLDDLKLDTQLSRLLATWRELGSDKLKVLPSEKRFGQDQHVLQVSDTETKYYLSKETHLLTAIFYVSDSPADAREVDTLMSFDKYAKHDGVKLPGEVFIDFAEDAIIFAFEYTKTKVNGEIDESLFVKQ